jgi:hypothetical protein
MKVRDRSQSNPGGELIGNSASARIPTITVNPFIGESSEPEHSSAAILGKAVKVREIPTGVLDPSPTIIMPTASDQGSTMPMGGDGVEEMQKASGPATLHIGRQAYSNNTTRPSDSAPPSMSEIVKAKRNGTFIPLDKTVENTFQPRVGQQPRRGPAIANPSDGSGRLGSV